ncbi:MAG: hypothetical protein S0880_11685 [Actinomycetota bacterium]|nr:hypothetical protein [Actinomycetota bacterium]
MAAIRIEGMPERVFDTLRARASARGQSVADYALGLLVEAALMPTAAERSVDPRPALRVVRGPAVDDRPTPGDVADRSASDRGETFSLDEAVTAVRDERDGR